MEKTIKYKKDKTYGRERFYIVDLAFQKNYEKLTGKQTLTKETMQALTAMGFVFEQVLN
jgi:hypothetical protein